MCVLVRTANVYAVQWGAVHLSYAHVGPLIIITECTYVAPSLVTIRKIVVQFRGGTVCRLGCQLSLVVGELQMILL